MKCEILMLGDIAENPTNARGQASFKKDALKDLSESIKKFGVAVPIIVQKNSDGKGYMLIAGHRRLAASKLAGMECIQAIVVDGGSGLSPEEIAMLENKHREGLSLLEEIKATNTLLEYSEDLKTVADKLGLTLQQVKLRKNIAENLKQEWIDVLDRNTNLTASHLELIARLPATTQIDLLRSFTYDLDQISVADLKQTIEDNYMRDIKTPPWNDTEWDEDAAETRPPKCAECMKRTDKIGQGELFASAPKKAKLVQCLDAMCFENKKTKLYVAAFKVLQKTMPTIGIMRLWNEGYSPSVSKMVGALGKIGIAVQTSENWKKNKKGQPFLMLNGDKTGQVEFFSPVKTEAGKEKPGRKALNTQDDKVENLRGLRLKLVYTDLIKHVEAINIPEADGDLFTTAKLACLLAVFGLRGCGRTISKDPATIEDLFKHKKVAFDHPWDKQQEPMQATIDQILWLQALQSIVYSIPHDDTAQMALNAEPLCMWLGNQIGFDWAAAMKAAEIAKPEPKSWKK